MKHLPFNICFISLCFRVLLQYRMLLRIFLGSFVSVALAATNGQPEPETPAANGHPPQSSLPPPLLLVSFDGFRADYLQRFHMPNLELLYRDGVLVEEMTNVFTTKTFPNHYSLVGLASILTMS